MKELVAYLGQNARIILGLAALAAAGVFASRSQLVFPLSEDPFFDAPTEDPNPGMSELMELEILKSETMQEFPAIQLSQPAGVTFTNILAEWQPPDDCTTPDLRIRFNLENGASYPLSLRAMSFLVMLLSRGQEDGSAPDTGGQNYDFDYAVLTLDRNLQAGDPDNLLSVGGELHYDVVLNHPDILWLPTGVDTSTGAGPKLPSTLSEASMLIMGFPEVAGNFKETADGETGGQTVYGYDGALAGYQLNVYADIKPVVGDYNAFQFDSAAGDPLPAFLFSFKVDHLDGTFGPENGPSAYDGAVVFLPSIEYPNLVFSLPEDSEEEHGNHVSNAIFVFTGGPPAEWDEIEQLQISDFAFLQEALAGMAFIDEYIEQGLAVGGPSPCTPTAPQPLQATTSSDLELAASATPRSTVMPTRTPEPTVRPTSTPKIK